MNNVEIGDIFKTGKENKAQVVDFAVQTSVTTGKVIKSVCIAKAIGSATNEFEVPFSTVVINRISK